jgi:hypothetical protein
MAPRLTDRDRALRAVTEKQWQKQVEQMLTVLGWRFFHAPDNRPAKNGAVQNVKAGWPDLFAVRGKRAIAIELKSEIGRTSPDQDEWLADLAMTGIETYVWRPRDANDAAAVLAVGWAS